MSSNSNYLDLFFRISLEISSLQNLDQLLNNVLGKLADGMDMQRGMIQLFDESGKRLLLKAQRGIPEETCRLLAGRKVNDDPLAVRLFSTGTPLVETNVNKIDKLYKNFIKSGEPCFFVYCPIKTSEELLGLVILQGAGFRELTSSDMSLLSAICRILGEAIKHSRMDSETIHRANELNLLQNINTALNSAAGLEEIFEIIAGGMVKVFGYTGSMVFLDEEGTGQTITLKALAYDPKIIKKVEKLLGFSLKGHVFKPEKGNTIHRLYYERQPLITNNISDQLEVLFRQKLLKKMMPAVAGLLPVASALLVPLLVGKKANGILVVASQRDMDENDVTRVKAFATQAAMAIEKAQLFEDEQRRTAELSALCSVSSSISSSLNLKDILQNTAKQMVELLQVDHSGILAFDQDQEWGNVLAEYPDRGATSESFSLKGYKAAERIIAVPKPLMIEDARNDPLFAAVQDTIRRLDIHSMLILPLVVKGKTIGSIGLDAIGKPRSFRQDEISLAQAIADQVSVAIENARLFEDEHRQRQVNETLREISQVIGSTLELDDVLKRILGQLKKVIDCQAAAILLIDEEHKELYVKVAEGFEKEAEKLILPLDGERGVTVYAARTGEPKYVPDIAKDKRHVSAGINSGTELAVPLKIKDEVIGVLDLESEEIDAFSQDDIQLISTFASQAGIAIENARLFEIEQSRRRLAETLGEISRVIGSTLDLDSLLHLILEQLKRVLKFDTASILLFSEEKPFLAATLGYKDEETVRGEMSLRLKSSPILQEMVRTHRSIIIADVREEKGWIWVPGAGHVRSWIGVPILVRNEVIGGLSIDSSQLNFFTRRDVEVVQALAGQTAVALENARLYERVKRSEKRFRDVTANTGDWVWEVDSEGRYTYSSPVAEQILGYTPQEVLGKHFYDFFLPEEREKLKTAAFEVFERLEPFTTFVNFNLHKDGHTVILETSGTPMISPDGKLSGYSGVDRDITARVRAEEALAASEHKYRILVEHANDWIWTLDRKGNLTFFNRAAEEASGYKSEDWLGKSFTPLILPEDLKNVQEVFINTLAGESQSYEVSIYKRDGKLVTLAVNTAPLYEGNRIVGTVSMGRDVSIQKHLEDQLREAQKMEALGTLAGGIAHDFNNILGGILGYTSFIKSELPTEASLRTEVDAVISLVRRAAGLTEQLLAFARGGRYQVQPLNLNDIVDEVVKLLLRTVDKAILIKPVMNPDLAAIEGDSGQIQQMILNLCLNARDAMPGGGRLLIETENVTIDDDSAGNFPGLKKGSYVLLSVSDTGMGMDTETKARIFDPFFTRKEGQGAEKHSGLGLSMVYGIVQSHSGAIEVDSEIGRGTTFRVYIPSTAREVVKPESILTGPLGGKETLLVVDDEEIILKPVKRILNKAGYKVLLANGGREALEFFRKRHKEIDLIILDMIMPDMNGSATYKELKRIDPDVKVLLSSGYSQNGQAQELLDDGVRGFLQKPYELKEMLHKVRQVLDEC